MIDANINSFIERNVGIEELRNPQGFNPVFYGRYADDIFVLSKLNDHLNYFQGLLNSYHINMSFSMETERQIQFSFLDV